MEQMGVAVSRIDSGISRVAGRCEGTWRATRPFQHCKSTVANGNRQPNTRPWSDKQRARALLGGGARGSLSSCCSASEDEKGRGGNPEAWHGFNQRGCEDRLTAPLDEGRV